MKLEFRRPLGRRRPRDRVDARGLWLLTGDAAHSARVSSGGSRLSADRIELDRRAQQVRGEGRARRPRRRPAEEPADGDLRRRSGTPELREGRPHRPRRRDPRRDAVGLGSLWQDDSSLFADDITLSDADKTVNGRQTCAPCCARPAQDQARTEQAAPAVTAHASSIATRTAARRFEGGVAVTRGAGWKRDGRGIDRLDSKDKDRGVDCMEISGDVDLVERAAGRTRTPRRPSTTPSRARPCSGARRRA